MLEQIKGGLIVSCQALPDEPLHSSFIMGRMALAAQMGGAVGIRAQGMADILEIKKQVHLPVIGIVKRECADSTVYITPTKREVEELLQTGCEMIALDATKRPRPNGEALADLIHTIKAHNVQVMADCSTYEEAIEAALLGADCVSTTLCGYTPYSELHDGPDYALLACLVADLQIPVIAEGKINTPEELREVFKQGCYAAVVGGAITRPRDITARFVQALG